MFDVTSILKSTEPNGVPFARVIPPAIAAVNIFFLMELD